jgi:hypothetical protein
MLKILIVMLFAVLAMSWAAPWFTDEDAHRILSANSKYRETCNEYNKTHFQAMTATVEERYRPGHFGKLSTDCGKRWYVTFWGAVYVR